MSYSSTKYQTNVSIQLSWKTIFILQWDSVPLALRWMTNRLILLPGKIAFILKGVKLSKISLEYYCTHGVNSLSPRGAYIRRFVSASIC